jgi:hypothetical protein
VTRLLRKFSCVDSVFVSVVVGYALRVCVEALECFPIKAKVTKFVADVAVVAIVIDRKMRMRANNFLLLAYSG